MTCDCRHRCDLCQTSDPALLDTGCKAVLPWDVGVVKAGETLHCCAVCWDEYLREHLRLLCAHAEGVDWESDWTTVGREHHEIAHEISIAKVWPDFAAVIERLRSGGKLTEEAANERWAEYLARHALE